MKKSLPIATAILLGLTMPVVAETLAEQETATESPVTTDAMAAETTAEQAPVTKSPATTETVVAETAVEQAPATESPATTEAVAAVEVIDDESFDDDDDEELDELSLLKQQVRELQKQAGGNNIKFSADYRVTMDGLEYKMANGDKHENSNLFSNRLEIGMGYQPTKNLIFHGLLSYNKAFGESMSYNEPTMGYQNPNPGMGDMDWIVNENPSDNSLRVKEAYMLYLGDSFLGSDLNWSGSIGRRPSTGGFLSNHRNGYDDDNSPLGHSIDVEFDGFSLMVKMDELTGVDGMSAKLCAGRGVSASMTPRFSGTGVDYTDAHYLDNTDMAGLILTPYNNGQYDFKMQYYYATNMLDSVYGMTDPMDQRTMYRTPNMEQIGDLQNLTLSMEINGIGEFINDFLDDTVLFASVAASQTVPDSYEPNMMGMEMSPGLNMGMLGSNEKETGYSYWLGANFPLFIVDGDKFGLEFNHGSEYWRSFTYGEDTLVGSKIAARGNAYEAYYNLPIVGEKFYFQLRYTFIDYDYSGSNGFFGNSGAPMDMDEAKAKGMGGMVVDSAQDLRLMLRYKY